MILTGRRRLPNDLGGKAGGPDSRERADLFRYRIGLEDDNPGDGA